MKEEKLLTQLCAIDKKCDEILKLVECILNDPDYLVSALKVHAKKQLKEQEEVHVPFSIIRHGR